MIERVSIPLQQIDPDLPVPAYAYVGDAGVDLRATCDDILKPFERKLVPCGIAVAIPSGYAGFVLPRSGLAIKHGVSLVNAPGLIDSNYRGEIQAILVNLDPQSEFAIKRGDRIAQLVVMRVPDAAFDVCAELPDTKIILISGHNDFEFAQEAIEIGVEQYLLKPVTKSSLLKTLEDVSRKIDEEREQKAYLRRFQQEGREYEQYARRKFFEQVTSGSLRVSEIYEQAKKLQIDIDAEGYTVILLTLQSRGAAEYSQTLADRLEELMAYLLRYGEYLLFRCNLMTYCIIVKGSGAGLNDAVHRCLENIQRRCGGDEALAWYAAVSDPVARLSELPGCYARAHTILSYRHLLPEQHVLTADVLKKPQRGGLSELDEVDASKADPAIIRSFLQTGMREEIPDFVSEYLSSFGNALNSLLFRQYVLLELRFSAIRAAKSFGYSQEEFLRPLEPAQARAVDADLPELKKSCAAFLRRAIELREEESGNQYKSMLKRALHYIDQNYTDENLSLNAVAKAANISPNYFSGVFSQEMGQTFVEYLTEKRMARAKELLRYSGKRSSEVAYEVGYRDPRYFSFLFKKTQGCTPSSYRAGNGDGHEAK